LVVTKLEEGVRRSALKQRQMDILLSRATDEMRILERASGQEVAS
jgi:hypothetical protein